MNLKIEHGLEVNRIALKARNKWEKDKKVEKDVGKISLLKLRSRLV
jgi:hypothetical protein